MSINGVYDRALSLPRTEMKTAERPHGRPLKTIAASEKPADYSIDIKAIKAILYLGIKGDVYLPLDDGHFFNSLI